MVSLMPSSISWLEMASRSSSSSSSDSNAGSGERLRRGERLIPAAAVGSAVLSGCWCTLILSGSVLSARSVLGDLLSCKGGSGVLFDPNHRWCVSEDCLGTLTGVLFDLEGPGMCALCDGDGGGMLTGVLFDLVAARGESEA